MKFLCSCCYSLVVTTRYSARTCLIAVPRKVEADFNAPRARPDSSRMSNNGGINVIYVDFLHDRPSLSVKYSRLPPTESSITSYLEELKTFGLSNCGFVNWKLWCARFHFVTTLYYFIIIIYYFEFRRTS